VGKKSGILDEWLKNMTSLIFMQTFHAIFLAFIVELIGNIQSYSTSYDPASSKTLMEKFGANDTKIALIIMVAMLALLKMEKMIKDLFGLKDSKYGKGLQDSLSGGVGKIAGAMDMAKRTGKAINDRKEAGKKLKKAKIESIDAKEKHAAKKKAYDDLVKAGPSGSHMNRKQYMEKLEKARKEAQEAKENMDNKKTEERKAKADVELANKKVKTSVATDAASMAFSLGDPRLAALTDRGLDAILDSRTKSTVYGSEAKRLDEEIKQKTNQEARQRVKDRGISETDPNFEREVQNTLNDAGFKQEMQKKLKAEIDAKLKMEMEIPEGSLKNLGKDFKNLVVNPIGDIKHGLGEVFGGSAGRAYSRKVRKNGIEYKGTNISNVDDI